MSLSFSKRWARYLAAQTKQSSENEAILVYVIEVILINIINTTIMLLLGLLFDVLPSVISCLITINLLRFTAGGAHLNSPWRCSALTACAFLAITFAATYLSTIDELYINILATIAITIGTMLFIRFAPVDSPAAPIISDTRRKRLKIMSLIVLSLAAIIIVFLPQSTWIYARETQVTVILCILWSSFNLTNSAHRLMAFIDRL